MNNKPIFTPVSTDPNEIPPESKYSSGGGGGNMEDRVLKLESDVNAIKTDISIIKATMATDSRVKDIIIEMHSNTTKTICWLVGTMIAISGLSITIAKLIF